MTCAIEDVGFEIRDQIMWVYGSGFPKSRNLKGEHEGWGTALKPAHEPIVMARKPLIGSVAANVEAHGTGAINIDGCRVPSVDALGRWPANFMHDGSAEVVNAFPVAPGQQGDLKAQSNCRQSPNGIFGGMRPALDHPARGDSGSAARFFYCAKTTKADRDEGLDQFTPQDFVAFQTANGTSGKASSLSEGRNTQYRNAHPTVKPTALMRWLVRLVTPVGGVVLDPFMGSGSTGKAAALEGLRFIGCELLPEHLPIAQGRIQHAFATEGAAALEAERQGSLFAEVAA